MGKKILVWFRNDIRIHDNEMLIEAIAKSDEILPVFTFDPRQFQQTAFLSLKTGPIRAQFLLESVADLQQSFQNFGGDLLVRTGFPEQLLPELVSLHQINEVYHHREVASEETLISTAVEDALWKLKVNLKHFIGHTLYNKEDLPFPIKDIPDVFTQFKKKTERDAVVKPCIPTPEQINFVEIVSENALPTMDDLFEQPVEKALKSDFVGGEKEALLHLHDFLHKGEDLAISKSAVKKIDVVSRLSAWLSLGCISPRQVYWKMREAEQNYGLKPYFHQIVLGLLWRDYYRFMFKKYRNTFFQSKGFSKEPITSFEIDEQLLSDWKTGQTENAKVNAVMHELNATGYITNAARQLSASYLIDVLKLNWIYGAYYFEEKLIDYNPASNWGNWANVAGVGNDSRLTQRFDFEKLSKSFEPKGIHSQALGT